MFIYERGNPTGRLRFGIDNPYPYDQQLHLLAQVCRAWADIARTPELWTVLDAANPNWRRVLALSRTSPLSIAAQGFVPVDSTFWPAIVDNLYRWKAAEIILPHDFSVLEKTSAPILETLSLTGPRSLLEYPQHRIIQDLFNGDAPRLRSLTLDGVGLRNWGTISSGLHLLHLYKLRDEASPSIDQIMGVLRRSPDLRSLAIASISVRHGVSGAQTPVIHLPRLRRLVIYSSPADTFEILLGAIHCPSAIDLNLESYHPQTISRREQLEIMAPAIASFITHSFAAAIRTGRRIKISFQVLNRIVVVPQIESAPHFSLISPIVSSSIGWLRPFLEQHGGRLPITVTFSGSLNLPLTPSHALSFVTLVDTLEYSGITEGVDRITKELSQPKILSDGSRVWLFPALKHMDLDDGIRYKPSLLLEMVRARNEAALAVGEGEAGKETHPVLLESIKISKNDSSMDLKTWKKIKKIIGEGASWDHEHGRSKGVKSDSRAMKGGASATG